MFYTYVLQSSKDKELYIGYSADLRNRLNAHNSGVVEATRSRKPFTLVYYEACLDETKAIKREKYFKTGFGRRFLQSRI
ncbi:MAG: GIY-YIG nuclease family protein [Patescibacteria group bacterium]